MKNNMTTESVSDFKQRIAIMMRERETGKKFSLVGASRAAECVVRKNKRRKRAVIAALALLSAITITGCDSDNRTEDERFNDSIKSIDQMIQEGRDERAAKRAKVMAEWEAKRVQPHATATPDERLADTWADGSSYENPEGDDDGGEE